MFYEWNTCPPPSGNRIVSSKMTLNPLIISSGFSDDLMCASSQDTTFDWNCNENLVLRKPSADRNTIEITSPPLENYLLDIWTPFSTDLIDQRFDCIWSVGWRNYLCFDWKKYCVYYFIARLNHDITSICTKYSRLEAKGSQKIFDEFLWVRSIP